MEKPTTAARADHDPDSLVVPVHTAVPGRARFKVAGLYHGPALKEFLEGTLREVPEVRAVAANVLTGNVLVLFDRGESVWDIRALVEEVARSAHDHIAARPRRETRGLTAPGGRPAPTWHARPADEAVAFFSTSKRAGLSQAEAAVRLDVFGPNRLRRAEPRSGLGILLDQVTSLPVGLLGAAAALSLLTGGVLEAVAIAGVVLINAGIGYATESQTERTITALSAVERPPATVLRDGLVRDVPPETVVPGDLLVLRPGSFVAADARVVAADRLTVDESALTGESVPVTKTAATLRGRDTPLAERANLVFMDTVVAGGSGLAVVVATGERTEIGAINALVEEVRSPETPMQRQLDSLGRRLVWLCGAICGLVFVAGLLRGYDALRMLKSAISLAVAAVPEGLPAVATTVLALGVRDLRRHGVLVRRLDAVEVLGAVEVVCLDKTGTLTLNRMSVVTAFAGMRRVAVDGGATDPPAGEALRRLVETGALCNEARLAGDGEAGDVAGSSTEAALLRLALDHGVDVAALRRAHPLRAVQHRAETQNFMITRHAQGGGRELVAVKGSPSEVLRLCRWHLLDGERRPLTDEDRAAIEAENERMAGEALRVLGVAHGVRREGPVRLRGGLTWLGLVGMADPLRPGMARVIREFHEAGIKTLLVTGDQRATARAVARALRLNGDRPLDVADIGRLERRDPEAIAALIERATVFARVSPAHKLELVQACQGAGRVTAMTGDGVNDGPALKAADIGVAMGGGGTEVARQVADVVLENDDPRTMLLAIGRGRAIYDNGRKSIHFILSTNLSEIMVVLAATVAGAGQPLSPLQLLWINLVTDVFPALALAVEPPEADVLRRPPRDPEEPIITATRLRRIGFESATISAGALAGYGYGVCRYGLGARASTIAFTSLVAAQLLHALSCRSDTRRALEVRRLPANPYLNVAVGGSLLLQLLIGFVPGLRNLLGMTPIGLLDGLVVGGSALLPFAINNATKPSAPGDVVRRERGGGPRPGAAGASGAGR